MTQRLWIEVIAQAIRDARGEGLSGAPRAVRDAARADVLEWAAGEDFLAVCDLAQVDSNELRRGMRRLLGTTSLTPAPNHRYKDLDPELREEVRLTQLDRDPYLKGLAHMPGPEALEMCRRHLDAGLTLEEALA